MKVTMSIHSGAYECNTLNHSLWYLWPCGCFNHPRQFRGLGRRHRLCSYPEVVLFHPYRNVGEFDALGT
eukprot:5834953-Amphidinium_carterae.1